MKKYILIYALLSILMACNLDKEVAQTEDEDDVAGLTTTQLTKAKDLTTKNTAQKIIENEKFSDDEERDSISQEEPHQEPAENFQKLRPQQQLLASLTKGAKVEFAPLDQGVIQEDTTITSNDSIFEISYETRCLNDSLIAQEMYDYGGTNAKSYLISHNYKTDVSISVDGVLKGNKTINKDMFKDKLELAFLEKSILKHPRFVKFNEETNEAVFEFIVGVPNTDWLVLAGVNLNDSGELRIIDIVTSPGM